MELKLVHSGDFSSFLFSFDDLYSSGAESFDSVAVDECFCSFSLYVYWNTCGLCQYSRLLVSSFSLLFVDLMAISPILIIIPISSVCSIANPSHSHRRDCAACKYFIKYSYFCFSFHSKSKWKCRKLFPRGKCPASKRLPSPICMAFVNRMLLFFLILRAHFFCWHSFFRNMRKEFFRASKAHNNRKASERTNIESIVSADQLQNRPRQVNDDRTNEQLQCQNVKKVR